MLCILVEPMTKNSNPDLLIYLANCLRDAGRVGGIEDTPESTRYIQISATLAALVESELRLMAENLRPSYPLEKYNHE